MMIKSDTGAGIPEASGTPVVLEHLCCLAAMRADSAEAQRRGLVVPTKR
jgi:hypothetical protein